MWRLKLAGALLLLAAGYGGWRLLLRDSSLFAIRSVTISGLRGDAPPAVADALTTTARRMTTTDFDVGRLRGAVAGFTIVKDVRATTHFPNGLRITVVEEQPVAALTLGSGSRVPVAADGTVLRGLRAGAELPSIAASALPRGRRVSETLALAAVAVLGPAPAVLRSRVARVAYSATGLTLYLRRAGPQLYFGDAQRPRAKWAAAAAVLADPGSLGARYIDLRLPDRPTAEVRDPATAAGAQIGAFGAAAGAASATGAQPIGG